MEKKDENVILLEKMKKMDKKFIVSSIDVS
jgi:hypothetical protein